MILPVYKLNDFQLTDYHISYVVDLSIFEYQPNAFRIIGTAKKVILRETIKMQISVFAFKLFIYTYIFLTKKNKALCTPIPCTLVPMVGDQSAVREMFEIINNMWKLHHSWVLFQVDFNREDPH